jgi:MFS family permease
METTEQEQRQARLRRNITMLRAIRSMQFFMLLIPVIVVYYNAHGMTMQDVMVLQALFSATMVIVEVPSGYFSDVLGRRRTMIIGSALWTAGWLVYCVAHDFASFLTAELILGVGISFISGTDAAMLYDTLLELGEEDHGIREEGRQLSYGHFSEAVSCIIGGLLAGVSLSLPLYVNAVLMLSLVPMALLLVEPAMHRRAGHRGSIVEIVRIVHRVTVRDHALRYMLAVSSILGASTLTFVWMLQPWMRAAGVPLWLFGAVWSGFMLIVGFSSIHAHRVHARHGTIPVILTLGTMVVVSYMVAGLWTAWWLVPVLASFYIARGVSNPVFTTAINQRTASHERATVLSVRQLGVRIVFVTMGPIVGWLSDRTSMGTALMSAGGVFAVLLTGAGILWIVSERRQRVTSTAVEA